VLPYKALQLNFIVSVKSIPYLEVVQDILPSAELQTALPSEFAGP
jgi:hypothetical protein